MAPTASAMAPFTARLGSHTPLDDQARQALLSIDSPGTRIRANHDMMLSGDSEDHACFVVEGVLSRYAQSACGQRQITALYVAGDMPDLHSVILPGARPSLQALSAATILRVPRRILQGLAALHPALALAFWRYCSADALIAAEWVASVGHRSARGRIAHLLCELAYRLAPPFAAPLRAFSLPMTQVHIADATGMTPVHVNRTLQELKRDGVVAIARHRVTIFDPEALQQAGDFDPAYLQLTPSNTAIAA